jgi:hypothetical protein
MGTNNSKGSNSRLIIAGALFITSIAASFLISFLSHTGSQYWTLTRPLPQGAKIESGDIAVVTATLDKGLRGYISASQSVVGSLIQRSMHAGELLRSDAISNKPGRQVIESLSLLIRTADIPSSTSPGDLVTLYQIHDARNGETVPEPVRILAGVFLEGIARKSANFGGDISLTLAVNREDVSTLLSATTSGRIVVVSSRG